MRLRYSLLILALLTPVTAALAPSARADVQIQEKITFDGFGGTGWGASLADTTTRLSGERLQQESTSKLTGKLLKFMPGLKGSHTGTITRLDKGMLYTVDYEGKSYIEMSLAEMGAATQDALSQLAAAKQPPPPPEGEEPPEVTCDPVELSVKDTGEKMEIAGLASRLSRIEGKQTCHNKETNEACTLSYVVSVWNTPVQGSFAELQAFMVRQAKAMGFDMDSMRSQVAAAGAFFPGGTAGMESALNELGKIEGHPVSTRFEIFTSGGCGGASGEGEAEPASGESTDSGMASMKKMFSKFKKKDDSTAGTGDAKKTQATPATPAEPGKSKIFGMTTEIVSISSGSVPAEHFEIPAGFKKEELPKPPKG